MKKIAQFLMLTLACASSAPAFAQVEDVTLSEQKFAAITEMAANAAREDSSEKNRRETIARIEALTASMSAKQRSAIIDRALAALTQAEQDADRRQHDPAFIGVYSGLVSAVALLVAALVRRATGHWGRYSVAVTGLAVAYTGLNVYVAHDIIAGTREHAQKLRQGLLALQTQINLEIKTQDLR